MKILELVQGSEAWRAHRTKSRNASEAAAMLGLCKYKTRSQLLREKATGVVEEIGEQKQRLFDSGHAAEAAARANAENLIGDELFPCTAVDEFHYLSASFDGVTMDESVCWEHKLWNVQLADAIQSCQVPDTHWPQLEHQLLVSGADRVLFMCSDGTEKNMAYMMYESVPERRSQVIAGWKQFDADLEAYEHKETPVEVVGVAPDSLPALRIEVTGMVTRSNLGAFREHAMAVIESINTDLVTDTDFANAEKTIKWAGNAEFSLDSAKEAALSQTADLGNLFRAIDDIREAVRAVRLNLEKQVKVKKEDRRRQIVSEARTALAQHVQQISRTLDGCNLPVINADFAGAIKGKRTLSSMEDAVSVVLANAKIEANQVADNIRINLATLRADSAGYESLFPDASSLVLKANDDMRAVIATRITGHIAAEKARLDARAEADRLVRAKTEAAKFEAEFGDGPDFVQADYGDGPGPEAPAIDLSSLVPPPQDLPTEFVTVMDELEIWRSAFYIPGAAYQALMKILSSHLNLQEAA